jgi:hypothetical protein
MQVPPALLTQRREGVKPAQPPEDCPQITQIDPDDIFFVNRASAIAIPIAISITGPPPVVMLSYADSDKVWFA